MMTLTVYCEICGEEPASHVCSVCGRRVCGRHARTTPSGRVVCVICESSLCQLCGVRLSVTYCISCGRLVCVDCSVQVDNVRRVCVECARRGVALRDETFGPRGASRLALRLVRLLAG